MDEWIPILLPFALVLARVGAFLGVAPIFGWRAAPAVAMAGLAFWLTALLAGAMPPAPAAVQAGWLTATGLLFREAMVGLAMGLAVRMLFQAVQQGGHIAATQMGLAESGVIDPVTGEEEQCVATFFEMVFAVFFLVCGGHHLLLQLLARSFEAFPPCGQCDFGALAEGLVGAGSAMLTFALKLAAPMLAGFLILSVVLAIVARILPEMNVLFESFPLRVGLGLFLAAAMMPLLGSFTADLGGWMQRLIA